MHSGFPSTEAECRGSALALGSSGTAPWHRAVCSGAARGGWVYWSAGSILVLCSCGLHKKGGKLPVV